MKMEKYWLKTGCPKFFSMFDSSAQWVMSTFQKDWKKFGSNEAKGIYLLLVKKQDIKEVQVLFKGIYFSREISRETDSGREISRFPGSWKSGKFANPRYAQVKFVQQAET